MFGHIFLAVIHNFFQWDLSQRWVVQEHYSKTSADLSMPVMVSPVRKPRTEISQRFAEQKQPQSIRVTCVYMIYCYISWAKTSHTYSFNSWFETMSLIPLGKDALHTHTWNVAMETWKERCGIMRKCVRRRHPRQI